MKIQLRDYRKSYLIGLFLILVSLSIGARPVLAQGPLPQDLIGQISFEQKLDEQLPLHLAFSDSTGRAVRLGDYFGEKPVILSLGYYECPMLCSYAREGLVDSLKPLDFSVGDEFELIVISVDPGETAEVAELKRRASMLEYGRSMSGEGWHFLVGDEAAIAQLAGAIGFRYAYDARIDQYLHPTGIVLLTPQGRVARYFYGIDYPARDLRLGLVETAANKIGSPVDQMLLLCYHYDPVSGEYTIFIMNIIRLVGLMGAAALGGFLVVMFRREE